ncbi:MAG: OprO/OprP family phosphate-selective porin [Muribaculaceae bacterium]|nr:OprO/OprP family phosphate-selective porin [Muribaculaceae bacterium]
MKKIYTGLFGIFALVAAAQPAPETASEMLPEIAPEAVAEANAEVAPQQTKAMPAWVDKVREHVSLNGYAQGGWQYHDKSSPSNEFSVDKIIFIAEGRFNDKISALFMYDFRKSALHELWVNYKPCKGVNIKVGEFKTPFSIENPISPAILEDITLTSLVTTDMIMGSNPLMMPAGAGRDLGITVYGDLLDKKLSYDLALMNGAGRNIKDINSQKDFVARLSYRPLKELMLSGSMVLGTGNVDVCPNSEGVLVCDAAPGVTGFKANGNFTRNRFAAGFQLKTAPANLRAEYMWGKDGDYNSNGCYVTGSLNNLLVKKLDLIASYDHLDNFRGIQNRYTVGLQYWFYKYCRVQLNYNHHKWSGRGPGENGILTQIQVGF